MDARKILEEVYVEYLASSVGQVTATELAALSGGQLSHDQISRALAGREHGSRDLWRVVKPLVRAQAGTGGESLENQAVLIVDDTLIAKPHSCESELVAWHFDHTSGRSTKGINLLSLFWEAPCQANSKQPPLRVPVGYELVRKEDPALLGPGEKPKVQVNKNALFRQLLRQAVLQQVRFGAVLADAWFASEENMELVHQLGHTFVFAIRSNRRAALLEPPPSGGAVLPQSRPRGVRWKRVDELELKEDQPCVVWLKGIAFPVAVLRHRYRNAAEHWADVYLCTNSLGLSGPALLALQKRRWSIEPYHKSLKQNAAAARAPLWSVRTQLNHLWASLCAYVQLEKLRLRTCLNHFALKAKIHHLAQQSALKELRRLSTA